MLFRSSGFPGTISPLHIPPHVQMHVHVMYIQCTYQGLIAAKMYTIPPRTAWYNAQGREGSIPLWWERRELSCRPFEAEGPSADSQNPLAVTFFRVRNASSSHLWNQVSRMHAYM